MKKLYIVYPRIGFTGGTRLICAKNSTQAKEWYPDGLKVYEIHARCIGNAHCNVTYGEVL